MADSLKNSSSPNIRRGKRGFRGRGGSSKRARRSFSPPRHKLPQEEDKTVKLTEIDLGITEYITDLAGFNGVIKQRYSDFLVNELKPDGTEVHLTNREPPPVVEDTFKPSTEEISDVLPQETWDSIAELLEKPSAPLHINVTEKSKDERRFIHQVIKKVYGPSLNSNTVDKNGEKFISVSLRNKNTPKRRDAWPNKDGEYVHFSLFKENMDTMEAVNLLAYKLHMKPNMITYAGTKDRRAKTCQKVCVKRVYPHKIAAAASSLRNLAIGDYEYSGIPLQLGQLSGNRFQIVLRNTTGTDEQIEAAMKSLASDGFINYFGLQRFGTQSVPTHHIGRALLQGNWKEAVELILKPRGQGESPNLQEMRKLWWRTRDAGEAYRLLKGRDKCAEGQLLMGLIKSHENDLVSALESIPRNARLMYMHAYQSFIWNQVLSRRVKEFGFLPVEGDLVLVEKCDVTTLEETADFGVTAEDSEAKETESTSKLPAVRALTASELSKYSIHDIVLPLPGHEVTYPGHDAAKWYDELMAKDGLSTASLKQNIRKYTLGGAYRKMIVLPSKVNWKIMTYSDATKPLILSDLDVIQKMPEIEPNTDGTYKALILDFCLPSSCYATMALREILKCDTSVGHQTSLNSYDKNTADSKKSEPSEDPCEPPANDSLTKISEKVATVDEVSKDLCEPPAIVVETTPQNPEEVPTPMEVDEDG